jgi:hypothetical protein
MKTLISLVTLIAIVSVCTFSASLYLHDKFLFAYSLVLASVLSFTFWIKSNDLLSFLSKKA